MDLSNNKCKRLPHNFFKLKLCVFYTLLSIICLKPGIAHASTNTTSCHRQMKVDDENECDNSTTTGKSFLMHLNDVSKSSILTMAAVSSVTPYNTGSLNLNSNMNMTKTTTADCPSFTNANAFTQTELVNALTAPCRYDRSERPQIASNTNDTAAPVQVYVRIYIFSMQSVAANEFQFDMQALLQIRYTDPRLAFSAYAPQRQKPIMGESQLRALIWVPHIFLVNEQDSSVLGTLEKDLLTSISPQGEIIISLRLQTKLYCWLKLQKFPFDEQYCSTNLESWMYNVSDVILNWEQLAPITFNANMQSSQYVLENAWQNDSLLNSSADNMWHGALVGNYSSLTFTVHLVHNAANYIIDYFIPSMIIVAISWVSFWIRADQTATRTILGCHTMLGLITLASSSLQQSAGYLEVFAIWFLICILFIFGSLVEFAFSYTIWVRKRDVEMRRVNSAHILKSTLTSRKARSKTVTKSFSKNDGVNYLTDSPVVMTNCTMTPSDAGNTANSVSSTGFLFKIDRNISNNSKPDNAQQTPVPEPPRKLATMTPQEVSLWLDRKSRFLFPLAFLIFNVFFWLLVLLL